MGQIKNIKLHIVTDIKKQQQHSRRMSQSINVTAEFSGGAELLFDKVKQHELQLDASRQWTIKDFIFWIRDNLLKERPELFIQGQTVRPGILVLVNNCDWELMGELEYVVQDGDTVTFISTLHGG